MFIFTTTLEWNIPKLTIQREFTWFGVLAPLSFCSANRPFIAVWPGVLLLCEVSSWNKVFIEAYEKTLVIRNMESRKYLIRGFWLGFLVFSEESLHCCLSRRLVVLWSFFLEQRFHSSLKWSLFIRTVYMQLGNSNRYWLTWLGVFGSFPFWSAKRPFIAVWPGVCPPVCLLSLKSSFIAA